MKLIDRVKYDLDRKLESLGMISIEDGLEPFINMKNMEISIDKIMKHLKNNNKIRVVGDYDVDGIMSTVIFAQFFEDHPELFGKRLDYFIPDRIKHGYGVSPLIMEKAHKDRVDLVITVDNGIAANEAINKGLELGLDIIITDHHTVPKEVPNIDTIVNPKFDENLLFKEISGATVAWAFCSALNRRLNKQIDMSKYLDLVSLTVLSDVMPLENLNRTLLKHGFDVIKTSNREVYKKIFTIDQKNNLQSSNIEFNLVPKINATGRLANANLGVELFLNEKIDSILREIEEINQDRKDITHEQLQLILPYAEEQDKKHKVIIVYHDELHEGVVGILASKLVEIFKKPSFVLTKTKDNEIYKGSARSLGNISVYELLTNQQEYLVRFGGHSGAAGLAINLNNIENLRDGMNKDLLDNYTSEDYLNEIFHYQLDSLKELDTDLANLMQSYEPFGNGFKKPVFKTPIKIKSIDKISGEKHYFCTIIDRLNNEKKVWFFHMLEDMSIYINKGMYVYIDLSLNYWNGRVSPSYIARLI